MREGRVLAPVRPSTRVQLGEATCSETSCVAESVVVFFLEIRISKLVSIRKHSISASPLHGAHCADGD